MRVKTFTGSSMAEALKQVKRHFGADAVILNTRTYSRGGWMGLGARTCVEITAARDMSDLPDALKRGKLQARSGTRTTRRAEGAAQKVSRTVTAPGAGTAPISGADSLLAEIGSLKHMVNDLVHETRRTHNAAGLPPHLYDSYQQLIEAEVATRLADGLIQRAQAELPDELLHNPAAVRAKLSSFIEQMLPTAGPIDLGDPGEPTVIALIGPTGVGKTTTVAKLAANFCLRQNKRVGLITIDTYRIAAVEQLRTYANIINVPLEVVMSPEELQDAVTRMSDCEIILIDTAGRSQRDDIKLRELRSYFQRVKPNETHLVLSSTCGQKVLDDAIDRFSQVGVDKVIFTKVDEAVGFGVILSCLDKAKAGLSYITTGQDVPDDIEVGECRRLTRLILPTRSRDAAGGAGGPESDALHPANKNGQGGTTVTRPGSVATASPGGGD